MEGQRASAGGRRFGVVGLRGGGQEREEIAAGKRWRRKVLNCLGALLFSAARSTYWTQKGAPYGGHLLRACENREEGTPYAVGVHVDWGLFWSGERRAGKFKINRRS